MNHDDESRRPRRGLITFLAIVFLILSAAVVFKFTCRLENVEIRPGKYYTEDEIRKKLFTKATDDYAVLFAYRINNIAKTTLPCVEKIDVELVDRNSVIITVYDRAVTGCLEHMGTYLYFDIAGTVVDSSNVRLSGIPLVKGIEASSYTLGKQLYVGEKPVFTDIANIVMLMESNGLNTEELEFGIRNEITVRSSGNEILLGNSEYYDYKINNLPGMLQALGEGSYRIDLRNNTENNPDASARRIE